jgi:hypothetical protein
LARECRAILWRRKSDLGPVHGEALSAEPRPFEAGAAWRVNDAVVLAVETDAILIQTPTGGRQRIYRRSG